MPQNWIDWCKRILSTSISGSTVRHGGQKEAGCRRYSGTRRNRYSSCGIEIRASLYQRDNEAERSVKVAGPEILFKSWLNGLRNLTLTKGNDSLSKVSDENSIDSQKKQVSNKYRVPCRNCFRAIIVTLQINDADVMRFAKENGNRLSHDYSQESHSTSEILWKRIRTGQSNPRAVGAIIKSVQLPTVRTYPN